MESLFSSFGTALDLCLVLFEIKPSKTYTEVLVYSVARFVHIVLNPPRFNFNIVKLRLVEPLTEHRSDNYLDVEITVKPGLLMSIDTACYQPCRVTAGFQYAGYRAS